MRFLVLDESVQFGYISYMKNAKISEVKNQLSRYLDYVRRGGRVRILDRNIPVADIVPIEPGAAPSKESDLALLSALERQGGIRRGTGKIPPELLSPPQGPIAGVVKALLEERRNSR